MVIRPSRGSGRLRARQVERILSGANARDPVGAFLADLVQDLRDVSGAEVPSSVAARHLQKMRMATEMGVGGPGPLPELEEPELPPVHTLERRRPAVAVGLAAAMVVMVGIAASITGSRTAGTRAGSIVTGEVPPRSAQHRTGAVERFIASGPQTADLPGCGTMRLSALAVSLTSEVAPVLSQWPEVCPSSSGPARPKVAQPNGGAAVDQPLTTVVAGALHGANSGSRSGVEVGGGQGSSGGDTGSGTDGGSGNNPGSGGNSGGGEDPVGGGAGGTTEPGAKAKGNGDGHDKHRGKGGDGPRASDDQKGSGKKAGH